MPLKTFVKVGSITNLSDARYCAGMGVDLLGFRVIEGQDNHLAPKQFQEIRGWVTGPGVVAELYGIQDEAELDAILENYKPDYLEMGATEIAMFSSLPLPYILKLTGDDSIEDLAIEPAYLMGSSVQDAVSSCPFLLHAEADFDVDKALANPNIKGIAMDGSSELRPGLKEYKMLADILEQLDMD